MEKVSKKKTKEEKEEEDFLEWFSDIINIIRNDK